jgi:hypothetical protein
MTTHRVAEQDDSGIGAPVVPIWNTETLRAYLLAKIEAAVQLTMQRLDDAEKATRVAFAEHQRAVDLAFHAEVQLTEQRVQSQKQAIDAALFAQKEAVANAMAAADRAIQKAEISAEKRFEGVNEFRATLSDQQRTLMPRAESEALHNAMNARLSQLGETLTEKIDALSKTQSSIEDRKAGNKEGWQLAVLGIGLLLTVLTIVNIAVNYSHTLK